MLALLGLDVRDFVASSELLGMSHARAQYPRSHGALDQDLFEARNNNS